VSAVASSLCEGNKLRIPMKERDSVIKHFYLSRLHDRIHCSRNIEFLMTATAHRVQFEHDLTEATGWGKNSPSASQESWHPPAGTQSMVKRTEPHAKSVKQHKGQTHWWALSEVAVLDLIAVAAFELRNVHPFRQHPVNLGAETQVNSLLWQRSPQAGRLLMQEHHVKEQQAVVKPADRPGASEADAGRSKTEASGEDGELPLRKLLPGQGDLDDLMRRFSPRLLYENPGLVLSTPPDSAAESRVGLLSRQSEILPQVPTPSAAPFDGQAAAPFGAA
jgi:hypothetical protein